MAEKGKALSVGEKEAKKISNRAMINENYFVGLLWSDPTTHYADFANLIDSEQLIHSVWKFFYQLGKNMYNDGVKKFDEITVQMKAKEYGLEKSFEKYGGLDTIEDSVSLVEANSENIDYYAEDIQRNYIIRQLYQVFGEKVFTKSGKYNYEKLTKEQLVIYWQDKVNQISLGTVSNHQVENLVISADEFIDRLKNDAANMLPFYKSNMMNQITQGIPKGHVTMIGSFG